MRKVSMPQKILIGCVELGQYMMSSIITNSLLIFYTDYVGLSKASLFGIAMLIYGIWNGVNDPIFGYLSDKKTYVPGKGKRKPLMITGLPIMFAGFLMAALVPRGSSNVTIFFILLLGLILFDTGKALTMVNYAAYSMQIADDPQERSRVILVAKYVTFVPGALVGIIPTWFLTGEYSYFQVLGVFMAIVIPMTLITFFAVLKLEEPAEMYETSKEIKAYAIDLNFIDSVKYTLQSKAFLYFLGYKVCLMFAQANYYQNLIYMMKWVTNTSGVYALIISGGGGLLINVLYLVFTHYRKQYGTIPVLQGALGISIIGYILMYFATGFWTLLFAYMISIFCISSLYIFENVLLADIADEDMLKTGHQRQGIYASISGFFTTIASSIAIALLTFVFDAFGYVGTNDFQTPLAITGIRIIASIVPICGVVGCMIVLKFYPLQGAKYQELRAKMEEIYAKTYAQQDRIAEELNLNQEREP